MKIPKFGSRKSYLGTFAVEFLKNIVVFEISTLKFVKNEFLTHTLIFGMRSAFFQDPDPGPGPLYKVVRKIEYLKNLFGS